ncbi:guanylate kinase [Zeugodacus cucurbitae]|uniref:guanylate kinase n=1 Tax=Zeugodacus cucurbitae TaxID=28588 RepID=A0A0A1WWJ1_ZEUCU|nr:guanylate kinase [Zeugodacus cucurbitae]XP_011186472.2 guanylate kinase [Zeugodacus cucurbitae]XP_011186473.2 guanylate kinase [Zeugodacus cucurbitae]XP_011186475.2 guanylate kinase [Zeugodacus cucurbitae]XP_011186478.2 guanylate kinase [Zeugodacus cucurbitae]XP_011186479.2 guanylate kinase [Zeugodacus cucurbitae]XP_028897752.2 guanylate kinase [Zeugodacus cucurbitae]XP_054088535.1 guanylate kinase [Zeugodacus cucurbitae]XP_054088536.1 guanylate kinase [Zeugodacus cucurbitae]XP_05408853
MFHALKAAGANKEFTFKMYAQLAAKGPRPLVLCGPSGSGKSTLLKRLFDEYPNTFGFSISHTTRAPRAGEEHGVHYYFIEEHMMRAKVANNEFIETATFSGNMYGTSKATVLEIQQAGKVCVLDIEPQGVEQIKQTDLNPILVFNNPPTIQDLELRLRNRQTETEETLQKRLAAAEAEIAYGLSHGNFHKIIHNIEIDVAYAEFREFILNELKKQEAEGVQICWE